MPNKVPTHGDGLGIAIIVCGWLFQVLATIAVVLRVWARRLKKQPLFLNDHLAFGALVANFLLNIGSTWAVVAFGQGQHASDLSGNQLSGYAKSLLANEPLWGIANCLVKTSILCLYIQIFGQIRWFRIASYLLITAAVLYAMAVILEIYLLCRPLSSSWDKSIEGVCGSEKAAYLGVGVTNLLIDCCIIVLPLPVLWRLHMNTSRKIALSCIFSLGTLIIIITGIRIKALSQVDPKDPTYTTGRIGVYSVLEPTLGLINACLPVMQPVINHLSHGKVWSRGSSAWQKSSEVRSLPHRRGGPNRPFGKLENELDTFPLHHVETRGLPVKDGVVEVDSRQSSQNG